MATRGSYSRDIPCCKVSQSAHALESLEFRIEAEVLKSSASRQNFDKSRVAGWVGRSGKVRVEIGI